MKTIQIPWHPSTDGGPLGRNVEHDERSRMFQVTAPALRVHPSVKHRRHGRILTQTYGSCTGEALEAAMGCNPLHKRFERHTQKKAEQLYSLATGLDEFPGVWPPDDTGSSGLAVCKAAVQLGRLTEYHWAFGIEQALDALQVAAIITGVGWREGFDQPNPSGRVFPTGQVRGGHEFVVRGYDAQHHEVLCDNSWGKGWGLRGSFIMSVKDWAALLEDDGDVTVPLRG